MAKPVVIVEIGNDWLKIVEGGTSRSGTVVFKSSFKKLAQIKEPMAEAILSVWKELKFNRRNVISYIPRHLMTVRILELPSTNLEEIGEMINLQIGKQVPYSKEEIVFTYQIIDLIKEGYTKVMLAVAQRNIVNERLEVLRKAGIEVEKVTLSSEGVYHWFKTFYLPPLKMTDAQAVILVDVDSNYSDFLFFHKGKMAFTKNILIGANHLADGQSSYQEKFIWELTHSKNVCQAEWRGIQATKMLFSGAVGDIKDLPGTFSARLDIPCEVIDPLKDVNIKIDPAISISAILGLLIKPQEVAFNLIPNEMRIQKLMEGKRKDLTAIGVLLSATVMMLSLLVFIHIEHKNTYLTQIKQRIAKIQNDSDDVDRMRASINVVRDRLDAAGDCLNLLNIIYHTLPEKIYLTGIGIERKGRVSLKGKAIAMSEVFRFINKLESLPDLKNVQNTYATTNKENNSEYGTDFEITAVYNGQERR
ncbi:MAG: pilus assembly protein PilM [Candidatus Omnitrophica bacterium]|nr:pilus assembly protein PilM [Candidatus Omnitrophota bacterium]